MSAPGDRLHHTLNKEQVTSTEKNEETKQQASLEIHGSVNSKS